MNNIEILEEFIPLLEDGYVDNKDCTKEIQAIENLIKENKELKERIKGLECEIEIKKYCKVDEVINDLTYYKNLAKEYQGNCIPKSKLKEKIEELDKEMAKDEVDEFGIHSQGWAALDWTRDFLLKLLEEGE